ncbi:uncharacterized protein PV07_08294 [Cladophialophora immunda]|uniref:Uncharacterized protein n=1 Tax=Cladophialophora immunda TaxID=569365 RepID=A0A0D1ZKZ3_9EURO|nr:uncharacterized protein PV07_08294 [Cladophialophora immunda]KIW28651.1 hypothetical protein PV07_08294 [Cladophialophora immunda]OQV06435.1 hypothetical protein CLAIMM_10997 [Cladophialophora immunda]
MSSQAFSWLRKLGEASAFAIPVIIHHHFFIRYQRAEPKLDLPWINDGMAGLKSDTTGPKDDITRLKKDVAELKVDLAGLNFRTGCLECEMILLARQPDSLLCAMDSPHADQCHQGSSGAE